MFRRVLGKPVLAAKENVQHHSDWLSFLLWLAWKQEKEAYDKARNYAYKKVLWCMAFSSEFHKLHFYVSMAFCYQNCSDLLWEKIDLVIEKKFANLRLKARICKLFEITWTIYSNSERSEQFLVTICFFKLFLDVSHN